MKLNLKPLYEYLTHIRFFGAPDYLKNRKINIHNCTSNLHYWEEELSRGVYCSVCGKTVSQETYERPIDIDEDMTGSWSKVPSSSDTETYEPTSWGYDGAEDHSS